MGAKWRILAKIFANPDLPEIDDYYEPFTFDYGHLQSAGERAFDGLVLTHGLAAAGQAQVDGGPAGRIADLVLGAHLGHLQAGDAGIAVVLQGLLDQGAQRRVCHQG